MANYLMIRMIEAISTNMPFVLILTVIVTKDGSRNLRFDDNMVYLVKYFIRIFQTLYLNLVEFGVCIITLIIKTGSERSCHETCYKYLFHCFCVDNHETLWLIHLFGFQTSSPMFYTIYPHHRAIVVNHPELTSL